MSEQWLWADGGESACAPGCTMPALWGAMGAGCDGLALTVRMSRDGRLICVPDETVSVNGNGCVPVADLTSREIREHDAGAAFRSSAHNGHHASQSGEDTPWKGHDGQRDALYHPDLEEVLLHLGRRTRFLLTLQPGNGNGGSLPARKELAEAVLVLLTRHAVLGRVTLAGDADMLDAIGSGHLQRCLDPRDMPLGEAIARAVRDNTPLVLADARDAAAFDHAAGQGVRAIVHTRGSRLAIEPALYTQLRDRPAIAGYLVQAVAETHAIMHPRGLVLQEPFTGPLDTQRWVLGHSRPNHDSTIEVKDGLRIAVEGEEYSGTAALSTFSIYGDFDARMSFEVSNPRQGTTFELAALHVDAGYRKTNLTFDVHGAPPYASSERDEDNGFRIGWNNGPALTRWIDREPQSSNLYNCYGRDVGNAARESPTGRLRLTRRGDVYNAYYLDKFNEGWVLSGSVPVPALAGAVFLRLGAKHWPKNGNEPPSNRFTFTDFELYQWD
jgi:hypothetical protein